MPKIEIIFFWFLIVSLVIFLSIFFNFKSRIMIGGIIVLSIFQAASVINLYLNKYPVGIQPAYLLSIFFIIFYVIRIFMDDSQFFLSKRAIKTAFWLIIFSLYAIISSLILPRLFKNRVFVFPPRSGLFLESLTTLSPVGSNISQSLYILVLIFLFIFIVQLVLVEKRDFVYWVARIYLLSGVLVSLIGFYQIIGWYVGWSFPEEVLFTNPARPPLYIQSFQGIKRLSSSLLEPSQAAYYLLGYFSFSWVYVRYVEKTFLTYLVLFLTFTSLLLTTSTTAYLGLFILFLLFFIKRVYDIRFIIVTVYLFMIFAIIFAAFKYDVLFYAYDVAFNVLENQLFLKYSSLSFINRIGVDLHSISLVFSTLGLGVGLGSNRASSLIINILSNTGLPGLISLIIFSISLVKKHSRLLKCINIPHKDKGVLRAYGYSIMAMLIAGFISVPDLINLPFWINLALYTGLLLKILKN